MIHQNMHVLQLVNLVANRPKDLLIPFGIAEQAEERPRQPTYK
jgi:hypothetical protein